MPKTVAIIGASADPTKYSNKAIKAYRAQGWTVYPVNPNLDEVEGLPCYKSIEDVPEPIDRISVYVPPAIGKQLLHSIAKKKHTELYINPGAEDTELIELAKSLDLNPIYACSILA
ncbi:MAG: CoA-binding protein, partial [Candidatus Hydrogenedentes bacterium]|nr:CoA-binding protein [Candidatus Hydrogenedentota bacterium]